MFNFRSGSKGTRKPGTHLHRPSEGAGDGAIAPLEALPAKLVRGR
jgi:hypothetical protein